jgi:hypothetical protein
MGIRGKLTRRTKLVRLLEKHANEISGLLRDARREDEFPDDPFPEFTFIVDDVETSALNFKRDFEKFREREMKK